MSLKAGTQLGPYEIIALIGAGGMGEVYRARDPRLGREAAIKILPEQFTTNSDRLRRFEQEARSAGMLNHPNIVTVHDIGRMDGIIYVVSELLEGETLRERLQKNPIPPRKAVEWALQIAHGISAAHDKGIAHRDLKPENIFLTRDGRAKILDFGLAKLSTPETSSEQSNLMTVDGGTEPGMVLGTVGYMAPEQVRGLGADHRSDIFAFGAILYEMLTGARAFHGKSAADTMSAILKEEPEDPSASGRSVPPALERVIRHCLEKDPEHRFQSARDLAFDLEMISGISSASSTQHAAIASSKKEIPWKLIAPILLLAVVALAFWAGKRSAGIGGNSPSVPAMETNFQRLTDLMGEEKFPNIAPDGKSFVYVHLVNDKAHIFLSRVGGEKTIDLTADSDVDNTQPSFSPDGQKIAFRSERDGGGIFLMGATGESVKRLSDFGFNPAWSPDGKEIICSTEGVEQPLTRASISQLFALAVPNGEKRLIAKGDSVEPSWSPHGTRIAYWGLKPGGGQRDIATIDAKGNAQPVAVTDDPATDWNPFWSVDGKYLYFVSDRGGTMNLWRVPMDESTGKVLGPPQSVMVPSAWSGYFSSATNGEIIFTATENRSILQKTQFDPEKGTVNPSFQTVFTTGNNANFFNLSPDGKWFAFTTIWPHSDLYITRTDGSETVKLTDDPEKDRYPCWTPDGKEIYFMSDRTGRYDFWTIHPDGSGLRKATETTGDSMWAPHFSPDKQYFSASNMEGTYFFDTKTNMPWKNPAALPAPGKNLVFQGHSWSPDGSALAGQTFSTDGNPQNTIAIYSPGTQKYQEFSLARSPNVESIFWLNSSRLLILTADNHMLTLDMVTKKIADLPLSVPLQLINIQFYPDNTLYIQGYSVESDVWLMSPKQ